MNTNPTSVYIINDLINILVKILKKEGLICNFSFAEHYLNICVCYNSEYDIKTIIDVSISYDRMKSEGFDEIVNKIINKINAYLTYKDIKI